MDQNQGVSTNDLPVHNSLETESYFKMPREKYAQLSQTSGPGVNHQSLGASRCGVLLYFPDNFIHLGFEQHTPFHETFPIAAEPNAPVPLDGRDAVCSSQSRNGPSAVVCCFLRSMTSWCSQDREVGTLCLRVMDRSSTEAAKVRSEASQKRQMGLVNRGLLLRTPRPKDLTSWELRRSLKLKN